MDEITRQLFMDLEYPVYLDEQKEADKLNSENDD